MAARRLIAVLLVLLFLSSLAAALAPVEPRPDESTTTSSTAPTTIESPASGGGELIRQSIDVSNRVPPVIDAESGDQLQLRVTSREPGTLELARIGATEDVGPDSPALFDVLLRQTGKFPIRFLESERRIGTIQVDSATGSVSR